MTSFNVDGSTVTFASRESSGGTLPVSVDEHGGHRLRRQCRGRRQHLGFTVDPNGVLHPLAGSSRPLSATAAGPAEIAFNRTGEILTVTEKATQTISLYRVERGGYASLPSATPSAGKTPFGFVYTPEDVLVVTEAEGGSADGSTVSSYLLERRGLELASASVPDMQTAACWVAATADGRFAYVANAASGDISLYRINRRGALELANPAAAAIAMGKPLDTSLSDGDRFLYALDASHHVIQAFRVSDDAISRCTGTAVGLASDERGRARREVMGAGLFVE